MKKISPFLLALLMGTVLFGQAPVTGTHAIKYTPRPIDFVDLEQPAFYKYHPANMNNAPSAAKSSRADVEYIAIGTAYNLFTILLDGQNQVAYHPDINSVTFIHRQNDGTTGGSGGLSFDVSTDGGATWTNNNVVTPDYNAGSSPISGNRFPSASIYNPPGNTNPDLAFMVGNGPALDPSAPGSWGYTFRVSATLDGGNVDEQYYQTPGEAYDFHPYGVDYSSSGSLWSISTTYNNTGDPSQEILTYDKYRINEITPDILSMSFVYNTTDLEPDFHTYVPSATGYEENMAGYGWNIFFDPSGTTGYVVLLAGMEGAAPLAIKPVLYKTTDGGATWDLMPDFDFGSLTTFQDWTIPTYDGEIIPFFTSFDGVVDMNGDLHLITEHIGRSTSNTVADSLYFIWGGFSAFTHLSTSDGTDWEATNIGFSDMADGLFGTVGIPYRVQASRNTDGDKIFFTHTMSDSIIFTDHSAPDLYAIGYDIVSGEYTNDINFSSGTDYEYSMYFATTSPVTMDNGSGEYEIPVVFAVPGADENVPPQFYYVKGITFTDSDFGAEPAAIANFTFSLLADGLVSFDNSSNNATTYSWNFGDGSGTSPLENPTYTYTSNDTYSVCLTASNATSSDETCKNVTVTSAQGVEDLALAASLVVFPTPSTNVVQVQIGAGFGTVQLELLNLMGESVSPITSMTGENASLDVSGLPNGQYILKLMTDNGIAVRPVMIAR